MLLCNACTGLTDTPLTNFIHEAVLLSRCLLDGCFHPGPFESDATSYLFEATAVSPLEVRQRCL